MRTLLILGLLATACASSADYEKGKAQLEMQGCRDIKQTGHKFLCCSRDESFSTGFECTAANGKKVTGCICSEFLKGATIRYD